MPVLCSHILSRSVWPHKHVSFSAKHRSLVHEVIFFFSFGLSQLLLPGISSLLLSTSSQWTLKNSIVENLLYSSSKTEGCFYSLWSWLCSSCRNTPRCSSSQVQKRNTVLLSSALTSSSGVQALPSFATNLPLLPPTRSFSSLLRRFSLLNPQCIFFFFISATMAAVALEISSSSSFASGIFSAMGTGHGSVQQLGWCGVRHSPCMSLSPWG